MSANPSRRLLAIMTTLILAWVGLWGAWIPHQTAGLTQNLFDLADWSAYLPEVRNGTLSGMPDQLRLAAALAGLTLALSAREFENRWLRWGIRFVALLPGLLLLPPYPDVLSLWRSEAYGTRFLIAALLWLGVPLSGLVDMIVPIAAQRWVAVAAGVAAVILGAWAYLVLTQRFSLHYAEYIRPGWGMLVFVIGLMGSMALAVFSNFKRPGQSSL